MLVKIGLGKIQGPVGGPLPTLFFETFEKETCKWWSDIVLNGQMRVSK